MKQNSLLVKRIKGLVAVIQHINDDDSEENTSGMPSLPSMQKKNYVSTYLEYNPSPQADANSLAWWKLERTVSKLGFSSQEISQFLWY